MLSLSLFSATLPAWCPNSSSIPMHFAFPPVSLLQPPFFHAHSPGPVVSSCSAFVSWCCPPLPTLPSPLLWRSTFWGECPPSLWVLPVFYFSSSWLNSLPPHLSLPPFLFPPFSSLPMVSFSESSSELTAWKIAHSLIHYAITGDLLYTTARRQ